jgi:hypothetical protein
MKHYIVGKDLDTTTNDINKYWELGWEVATNHLIIKRRYKEGVINDDDVIVTRSGLEFLYSGVFKNVIDYSTFLKNNIQENCIELMNDGFFMGGYGSTKNSYFFEDNDTSKRYKYYEEDKDIILNIKTKDMFYLHKNKPYCVLVYRSRSVGIERNVDFDYYNIIINELKNKYSKIFLVGLGSEIFCDDEKVIYVNLEEYNNLINSNKCELLITPLTGLYLLANFYSKAKKNILLDHNDINSDTFSLESRNFFVGLGFSIKYSKSPWVYLKKFNIPNPLDVLIKESEI